MNKASITVHPQASDLLFKHYRSISKIFGDVLGQLEIDYIGITLLTHQHELLFFSSRPSIEWQMIERHLWLSDERFHHDFFMQEQPQTWSNPYGSAEFPIGFSVPSIFDEYRVIYTFASESNDKEIHFLITNNVAMLIRMGRFCLKNISSVIQFPELQSRHIQQKPQLKLVSNN